MAMELGTVKLNPWPVEVTFAATERVAALMVVMEQQAEFLGAVVGAAADCGVCCDLLGGDGGVWLGPGGREAGTGPTATMVPQMVFPSRDTCRALKLAKKLCPILSEPSSALSFRVN